MTIVALFNDSLDLRVHEFSGVVAPGELRDLMEFYQNHPHLVGADLISLIDERAVADPALAASLFTLREQFRGLQPSTQTAIVRRSVWVCSIPWALGLLGRFLERRHSRDGQGAEVRVVAAVAEASCLFEDYELRAVERREQFRQTFHSTASVRLSR
ncbi:MAG: hypothetical protein R3C30_13240 [Hyphomonadaceae bacterium]